MTDKPEGIEIKQSNLERVQQWLKQWNDEHPDQQLVLANNQIKGSRKNLKRVK